MQSETRRRTNRDRQSAGKSGSKREGETEAEDLLPNELNLFFGSRFPSQIVST